MNWTPLQRETLEAMGLSPYRLASAMPSDETGTTVPTAAAQPSRAEPRIRTDATRGDLPQRLVEALLRAAGRGPDAPDREAVLHACPPAQTLRGDPRAKRALWPTLRALRKH